MRLLHAGNDITVIALWLGHENTSTTQIYLQADMELKKQALDRTAPLGTRKDRSSRRTSSSPSWKTSDYADTDRENSPSQQPSIAHRHNDSVGIMLVMPISA